MRILTYKFPNPYNSCEEIYIDRDTVRHYSLIPYTPYSKQLCTCTPYKGYYEADCPVKAGLTYLLDDEEITTGENGEIVDQAKRDAYLNKEMEFFRIKPEFLQQPNYEQFDTNRLFPKLYDYMAPAHFDKCTFKRKDVCCLMGAWYLQRRCDP